MMWALIFQKEKPKHLKSTLKLLFLKIKIILKLKIQ